MRCCSSHPAVHCVWCFAHLHTETPHCQISLRISFAQTLFKPATRVAKWQTLRATMNHRQLSRCFQCVAWATHWRLSRGESRPALAARHSPLLPVRVDNIGQACMNGHSLFEPACPDLAGHKCQCTSRSTHPNPRPTGDRLPASSTHQ